MVDIEELYQAVFDEDLEKLRINQHEIELKLKKETNKDGQTKSRSNESSRCKRFEEFCSNS